MGGSVYAVQINKQKSIEKQQETQLQKDRDLEQAKLDQTKKEYIAKRKNECYTIYEKERVKWNNVKDVKYSIARDICLIKYESKDKAVDQKTCLALLDGLNKENDPKWKDMMMESYSDCSNNYFSKEY